MSDFIQERFAVRATRSEEGRRRKIPALEYKIIPPMLHLATSRATRLALNWTFGRFLPHNTSKLEDDNGEQAHQQIEWIYIPLQKPKISTRQVGTMRRALYGLAHMLARIQAEGR